MRSLPPPRPLDLHPHYLILPPLLLPPPHPLPPHLLTPLQGCRRAARAPWRGLCGPPSLHGPPPPRASGPCSTPEPGPPPPPPPSPPHPRHRRPPFRRPMVQVCSTRSSARC